MGKTRPLCQDILAKLAKRAPRPIRILVPRPQQLSMLYLHRQKNHFRRAVYISMQIVAKEACTKGLNKSLNLVNIMHSLMDFFSFGSGNGNRFLTPN